MLIDKIRNYITPARVIASGGLLSSSCMLLGFSRTAGGIMLTTYVVTLFWKARRNE